MKKSALGLIETYGFVGAVEALDIALKSANVNLVGCEFVKGGIVTIEITGDVGAVRASVEASTVAVKKLSSLITSHIIARPSEQIWGMLIKEEEQLNPKEDRVNHNDDSNIVQIINEDIEDDIVQDVQEDIFQDVEEDLEQEETIFTKEELGLMKVPELRTLARKLNITAMTKKEIKFGKKEELIKAIVDFYKRRDE
ncbi:BMC domain-containing protein [Clostridium sediminicola]|uniref:BMC domain-containing protein n=1 Tax=Clostridium sediminicola TaxID=3114879 RepID=UPI0031F23350